MGSAEGRVGVVKHLVGDVVEDVVLGRPADVDLVLGSGTFFTAVDAAPGGAAGAAVEGAAIAGTGLGDGPADVLDVAAEATAGVGIAGAGIGRLADEGSEARTRVVGHVGREEVVVKVVGHDFGC